MWSWHPWWRWTCFHRLALNEQSCYRRGIYRSICKSRVRLHCLIDSSFCFWCSSSDRTEWRCCLLLSLTFQYLCLWQRLVLKVVCHPSSPFDRRELLHGLFHCFRTSSRSIASWEGPVEVFSCRRPLADPCRISSRPTPPDLFFRVSSEPSEWSQTRHRRSNQTWKKAWSCHFRWSIDRVSHWRARQQACLRYWSSSPCPLMLGRQSFSLEFQILWCWLRGDRASHGVLKCSRSSEVDSFAPATSASGRLWDQWM